MTTPSIEFRHLDIRIGGKFIIAGIDMCLNPGQKAVIFGPSGTGKTTLVKTLLGFVRPSEGEISVQGIALDADTVWNIRKRMAYVPQEPDIGEGMVRDALKRPFGFRAAKGLEWNEERALELFRSLCLESVLMGQEVRKLSAGEKQRIAIVSALMLQRDIVIMDEPTSALDLKNREAVAELISGFRESTVLIATHDRLLVEQSDMVVDISGLRQKGRA
jgi:ABC-type multidrug transport system ATPase subunit